MGCTRRGYGLGMAVPFYKIFLAFSTLGISFAAQGLSVPDHIEGWELEVGSSPGMRDFTSRGFVIEGWGPLAATMGKPPLKHSKTLDSFMPYAAPKIFELSGDGALEKCIRNFQKTHPGFALQISVFFPAMWNKEIMDPFYLLMGRPYKAGDEIVMDLSPLVAAVRGLNDIYVAEEGDKKEKEGNLLSLEAPLGKPQRFYFLKTQLWGEGVEQNVEAASRGIKDLADKGDWEAAFYTSSMYVRGIGFRENPQEAFRYCNMAADARISRAQYNLGIYYGCGTGVATNFDAAFQCYQLAAHQGMALAQSRVAEAYEEGRGVRIDLEKAFKYYKLAADQGYVDAQWNLALFYAVGQGVESNLWEAGKYFCMWAKNRWVIQWSLG